MNSDGPLYRPTPPHQKGRPDMFKVAVPPPTITYTSVGNDVMASIDASKHTLRWERTSGAVYRDTENTPVYRQMSEHLFHVVAAEMFGGDRDADHGTTVHECAASREPIPAQCLHDGAGWQAACDCGHWRTGWRPSKRAARRALADHITRTRAEGSAARLDLAAVKRAGVRIPKQQRSAS